MEHVKWKNESKRFEIKTSEKKSRGQIVYRKLHRFHGCKSFLTLFRDTAFNYTLTLFEVNSLRDYELGVSLKDMQRMVPLELLRPANIKNLAHHLIARLSVDASSSTVARSHGEALRISLTAANVWITSLWKGESYRPMECIPLEMIDSWSTEMDLVFYRNLYKNKLTLGNRLNDPYAACPSTTLDLPPAHSAQLMWYQGSARILIRDRNDQENDREMEKREAVNMSKVEADERFCIRSSIARSNVNAICTKMMEIKEVGTLLARHITAYETHRANKTAAAENIAKRKLAAQIVEDLHLAYVGPLKDPDMDENERKQVQVIAPVEIELDEHEYSLKVPSQFETTRSSTFFQNVATLEAPGKGTVLFAEVMDVDDEELLVVISHTEDDETVWKIEAFSEEYNVLLASYVTNVIQDQPGTTLVSNDSPEAIADVMMHCMNITKKETGAKGTGPLFDQIAKVLGCSLTTLARHIVDWISSKERLKEELRQIIIRHIEKNNTNPHFLLACLIDVISTALDIELTECTIVLDRVLSKSSLPACLDRPTENPILQEKKDNIGKKRRKMESMQSIQYVFVPSNLHEKCEEVYITNAMDMDHFFGHANAITRTRTIFGDIVMFAENVVQSDANKDTSLNIRAAACLRTRTTCIHGPAIVAFESNASGGLYARLLAPTPKAYAVQEAPKRLTSQAARRRYHYSQAIRELSRSDVPLAPRSDESLLSKETSLQQSLVEFIIPLYTVDFLLGKGIKSCDDNAIALWNALHFSKKNEENTFTLTINHTLFRTSCRISSCSVLLRVTLTHRPTVLTFTAHVPSSCKSYTLSFSTFDLKEALLDDVLPRSRNVWDRLARKMIHHLQFSTRNGTCVLTYGSNTSTVINTEAMTLDITLTMDAMLQSIVNGHYASQMQKCIRCRRLRKYVLSMIELRHLHSFIADVSSHRETDWSCMEAEDVRSTKLRPLLVFAQYTAFAQCCAAVQADKHSLISEKLQALLEKCHLEIEDFSHQVHKLKLDKNGMLFFNDILWWFLHLEGVRSVGEDARRSRPTPLQLG